MKTYIATCYSHFGTMRWKKQCDAAHHPAVMMPVPRTLSSSCGTCAGFEAADDAAVLALGITPEIEQIVEVLPDSTGYRQIYAAPESEHS